MALPQLFRNRLSVPVIAAPMFPISEPELVVVCCRYGVAGAFPALNAGTTQELAEWLAAISGALAGNTHELRAAPYGVNIILQPDNTRSVPDLEVIVRYEAPFIITSLGNPAKMVEAVHGYGGLVLADVIHSEHARKSIAAGVDGLIAVGGGAGGHA